MLSYYFREVHGCCLCAILIANDYEGQKSANAAKLASAIAEARQAERNAAQSRAVQKAVLEEQIHVLMPTLPKTALDDFKQPAIMRVSARKVGR